MKILRVSSLQLSFSGGLQSSASLDGLSLLAAMVRFNCVSVDEAAVGDRTCVRWGVVDRLWSCKKSGVDFNLK